MSSPRVVWLLGSDSDLPHIEGGLSTLKGLGIAYEVRILSAHRTPEAVVEVVAGARDRGVGVLVGVAGGAAHLPGVMAAHTTLPVIGVPVPTELFTIETSTRRGGKRLIELVPTKLNHLCLEAQVNALEPSCSSRTLFSLNSREM